MKDLINGCIAGKRKARKELFRRYHKMLLSICLRYSHDKVEAEDILLDGFMHIYTKIETYAHEGSFEGWMKRIIVNTAIDYFRKNKNELVHQNVDDYTQIVSEESNVLKDLSAKDILALIQTMPNGYRIAFNLFAIEGFSHKEIAEKLQVTESTSKSQVRKARIWLMNKLDNNYE